MAEANTSPNINGTVYGAFHRAAAHHGTCDFLCIPPRAGRDYLPDGASVTYREAYQQVGALEVLYRTSGLGHRRIATLLESRPSHFLHLLAINAAGGCLVPLNPEHLSHEVEYVLTKAGVSLVLATGMRARAVSEVARRLGIPVVDPNDMPKLLPIYEEGAVLEDSEDDVSAAEALVIFTSGTTGRPKGCVISNGCALEAGRMYASIGGRLTLRRAEERLYVPLPTYHTNASVIAFNAVLATANCLILPERFSPSSWWPDIRATRATAVHYLGIIPPLLMKIPPSTEDRAHSVRFGLGAGITPELHRSFEDRFGFPMVEVWGMTETGRMIADAHEPREVGTRAFGKPLSPLEAKVADESGNKVETGEAGELLVRCEGPYPRSGFFSGYLGEKAETEGAWVGGWFHTGDIVKEGANGMFYFVERRKNIIRRSGENISAAEVESALETNAQISKVAVISVPDELRDEEIMACVVATNPGTDDRERAMQIFETARAHLTYYKLPGWIVFVDDIPVTGTQKVRKGVIFSHGQDPRTHPRAIDCRSFKTRKPTA